ncbi:LysR family substrate-binding domain-containing protein [Arenibaculum sp.]|uniref:LysR family substrate-binding domain-containing protein n=1 Tax=Arenibaculum sp. TaxID=2865862 RepID=UPI002E125D8D|nr:LysR family substrate-binding domain-containing protein [Arenibaculum sp.]
MAKTEPPSRQRRSAQSVASSIPGSAGPERFGWLDLWAGQLVAALPAGHPLERRNGLGWADLDAEPLVLRSWEVTRPVQALLERRCAGRRPPAVEHRVGRDGLLGLVAAGYGVAVVPEAAAGLPWPGVVFVPIAEPDAVVPVSLAWRPDDANPVLRRFLSHVRRHHRGQGRAAPAAGPPAPVRSPSRSR